MEPEEDFLGLLSLGETIRHVADTAKRLDLDRIAVQCFRIGWAARESGKWATLEEAVRAAQTLGRKVRRLAD